MTATIHQKENEMHMVANKNKKMDPICMLNQIQQTQKTNAYTQSKSPTLKTQQEMICDKPKKQLLIYSTDALNKSTETCTHITTTINFDANDVSSTQNTHPTQLFEGLFI